jgi:hypothetical protein
MDLSYGYALFRMITRQIDDDDIPDRIGAAIASLARTGVPSLVDNENGRRPRRGAINRK